MKLGKWVVVLGCLAGCSEAGADTRTAYNRATECQVFTTLVAHYDPHATEELRSRMNDAKIAYYDEATRQGVALGLREEAMNADKLRYFEGVQDRVRQVGTVPGSKEIQDSAQKCLGERP
ncbi:MAG TPA: hypothetical protein VEZ70_01205 [Allosphingosinicella sp.]|nr:hypothetical protein [Allosphingosinicella sp.]